MDSVAIDPQTREAKQQPQGRISLSASQLFRLDRRSILSEYSIQRLLRKSLGHVVMLIEEQVTGGGGGALGIAVAGAILESGGDVVCIDLLPHPPAEPWGITNTVAFLFFFFFC